ncbi:MULTISPECIES: DMT family transporter [unclassified Ensifer]|uniref:DMT family transporter n=1 Tax=unclassified Ensifer TaxID=2633371 RepID=UPI000812C9ED|nr:MULTISPECIES: DMT family transporter [unclassified Ensifer]OCO98356.1 ABC transporter permease [Ensifer sp. LC13]OCP05236.1 ABC transporter permease [Ensifer sp. LC14]OCP14586.1 ABC transporter permease [Ensifer sp. LC11]OCP29249.1 ABC transporter permease [Ensifer sp. LC499]
MGAREWGMLILLSLLWGGSFFFIGVAVKALPPVTIVALRVSLAAIALLVIVRVMGLSMPRDRRVWLAFFGMGLLNNLIPFSLIVWGQTHIASGLASILNATTPLFGVIVAHLLTDDEKLTVNRFAGVAVGFLGVAMMIGPAALGGLGSNLLAQLAVLGAALSYALAGVFARRFKRMGVAPIVTATGQVSASSIMLVPLSLLVDHPWSLPMPGLDVWAAIVGIALISTALAYVLFFRILETAGVTNLMLVTFLIPVSAILLGAMFLGETLEPKHFIGMTLIAAGLAAIDGRLLRLFSRPAVDPTLECRENV